MITIRLSQKEGSHDLKFCAEAISRETNALLCSALGISFEDAMENLKIILEVEGIKYESHN